MCIECWLWCFLRLNSDKDGLESKEKPALIRRQVSNTATVTTELCVTWWHVCWVPHELTGKNTSLRIHFRAKTSFPIEQKHWMIMDEQLAWCFSNNLRDTWPPDTWKHHFQPSSSVYKYIHIYIDHSSYLPSFSPPLQDFPRSCSPGGLAETVCQLLTGDDNTHMPSQA